MKRKHDLLCVLVVILVGIWGVWGLWVHKGLPTSHDSISHMARLFAYREGLEDGVFPVLWAKRLYSGLGSPVLMLSYQLPYYVTIIWNKMGINLDDAFKFTLSVSQVFSGIFMYLALRNRYGYLPALIGAVLYMLAPYRFLNIYVRGALGEVFSIMFPPVILAGIWRKSVLLQTLGWTGLFLSHPVGSAIYSCVMLGYTLIINNSKRILITLKHFFLPYVLAIMIAAFNILPTLSLTRYTHYSTSNSDTMHHFPTLKQLIYSNWGYGFSSSDDHDQMSFQIGVIQWAIAIMGVISIVLVKKENRYKMEIQYFIFIFVMAVALMIQKTATPLYKIFGISNILDYPWRMLIVFSFISSIIGAYLTSIMTKKWRILLVCFFFLGSIYTNRNHIKINLVWPWPSETFRKSLGDSLGEYSSIFRQSRNESEFFKSVEFIDGAGNIDIKKDTSNETEVIINAQDKSLVRFNVMYFPGWVVRIDDERMPILQLKVGEAKSDGCFITKRTMDIDDSGLVACYLKPGTSKLDLKYESLPVQRLANLITLAGIGIYIWILSVSFFQPTTKRKQ